MLFSALSEPTHTYTSTHRHTCVKIVMHEVMSQYLDVRAVTQPGECIAEDSLPFGNVTDAEPLESHSLRKTKK